MKSPRVSVCAISYNHEKFLRNSLDSILNQKTNFEFEIVIGEDFSTDSTRNICREYENLYPAKIRLILRDKNIGAMANFFDTIRNCRGDYIAYIETDDYWIDMNKLQNQFDFLEKNPDYGLIYTNFCYMLRDGTLIDKFYKVKMKSGNVLLEALRGGFPRSLTVFHRKSLITDEFYNLLIDSNIIVGDFPMYLYFAYKTKYKYFDSVTAQYNYNNNSLTRDNDYRNRLAFFKSGSYSLNKFLTSFTFEQSFIKHVQELLTEREKTIFYYSVKCKNKTEAQKSLSILINESKYRHFVIANYLAKYDIGITIIRIFYNAKLFFNILLKAILCLFVFDFNGLRLFLKQLKLTMSKYYERRAFNKDI